mmetsp:Transcript_56306/g.89694  ORF Transcript_56306/g.89694 Transcript_56306/m.89694 type:complete len:206 (-) Transcript_56306:678-1295(-)
MHVHRVRLHAHHQTPKPDVSHLPVLPVLDISLSRRLSNLGQERLHLPADQIPKESESRRRETLHFGRSPLHRQHRHCLHLAVPATALRLQPLPHHSYLHLFGHLVTFRIHLLRHNAPIHLPSRLFCLRWNLWLPGWICTACVSRRVLCGEICGGRFCVDCGYHGLRDRLVQCGFLSIRTAGSVAAVVYFTVSHVEEEPAVCAKVH